MKTGKDNGEKANPSACGGESEMMGKAVASKKDGKVLVPLVASPKSGMLKSPDFMIADDFDEVEL